MRRLQLALLGGALALLVILAGCAAPGGNSTRQASAAASPTASPTAPPTQTPVLTSGTGAQTCSAPAGSSRLGDLALSTPSVLYGFNADYMLPDGLPDKPLTVTVQNGSAYVAGSQLEGRAVVGTSVAFVVEFCNTSASRTYHLTAFGAKIASVTPYTGSLNALNGCAYLYGRPNGIGGECSSGFSPDVELSFTFANAAPQTSATQTPSGAVSLAPGQQLSVSYGIQAPAAGLMTAYQLGVAVDGQSLSYPAALATQTTVSGAIARRWAGDYCSTPQMQAQIPATIPANTYYVCPQA